MKRDDKRPKRKRYFGEPLDRGYWYRPKYVCLNCRKVIRVFRYGPMTARACGTCGGVVYPIGPIFKSPPANTNRGKKAWQEISRLIDKRRKFFAEKQFQEWRNQHNGHGSN